jgi:ubiquinone/menaquinone biosynthesis C-methylase UbiE
MDKTKMVINVFNKYANAYQDKFMDVDLYNGSFDLFCSLIPHNADILEIGCGPGNITRYLLNKHPGFKILGTDIAAKMLELAKINIPKAEFQLLDAREIHTINRQFDAIMCGFCLPYLSKEESIQLIHDAAALLKPRGVLYLSTMEDDYSKSGLKKTSDGTEQTYMYFHEADYLSETLLANVFKITTLERQDYPTTDGTKVTDLIIIASREEIL